MGIADLVQERTRGLDKMETTTLIGLTLFMLVAIAGYLFYNEKRLKNPDIMTMKSNPYVKHTLLKDYERDFDSEIVGIEKHGSHDSIILKNGLNNIYDLKLLNLVNVREVLVGKPASFTYGSPSVKVQQLMTSLTAVKEELAIVRAKSEEDTTRRVQEVKEAQKGTEKFKKYDD